MCQHIRKITCSFQTKITDVHFQPQQRDINKACVYTHTHMYTHTKYTCTPLCANYLSSICIWLGCTACSPWARPADIQAKINTRQLLGARDILVINSCAGLYNRDPPDLRNSSRTGCFISDCCLSGEGWKRSEEILRKTRRWETWRGATVAQNPIPSPARRPWQPALALPSASCAALAATTAKTRLLISRFLESVEE